MPIAKKYISAKGVGQKTWSNKLPMGKKSIKVWYKRQKGRKT